MLPASGKLTTLRKQKESPEILIGREMITLRAITRRTGRDFETDKLSLYRGGVAARTLQINPVFG